MHLYFILLRTYCQVNLFFAWQYCLLFFCDLFIKEFKMSEMGYLTPSIVILFLIPLWLFFASCWNCRICAHGVSHARLHFELIRNPYKLPFGSIHHRRRCFLSTTSRPCAHLFDFDLSCAWNALQASRLQVKIERVCANAENSGISTR